MPPKRDRLWRLVVGVHQIWAAALLGTVLLATSTNEVWAQRVALIIANSEYEHTKRLENPGNDARAIAKLLRDKAGFNENDIALVEDARRQEMENAIKEFAIKSRGAELAFVYFAGHGLESGGANYLLPVDAEIADDEKLTSEAILLKTIQNAIEKATFRIVILDACRENPLAERMRRTPDLKRAVGRGLARVPKEKAESSKGYDLFAFSAKAGELALDGKGTHSPYAQGLLKHLPQPGLDIRKAFARVATWVRESTDWKQEPIYQSAFPETDFYLVPPKQQVKATPSSSPKRQSAEPRTRRQTAAPAQQPQRGIAPIPP